MRSVRFHPHAAAEFRRAVERYSAISRGLGADLDAEVRRAIQRTIVFPGAGSATYGGAQRILLRRFPFSVIYEATEDLLWVIALAHHRRRPGYWLRRL